LRDLLGFFYWAASYTSSKILWRGRVYRLTENGLMQPVTNATQREQKTAMTA